ncbi:MAG: quinoprotein dehydrogenase-associated SoxYZ-like carrier [Candidatus Thiodiazotropha sp.]
MQRNIRTNTMMAFSTNDYPGWIRKSWLTLILLSISLTTSHVWAADDGNRWFQIKTSLFGDKLIQSGEAVLGLVTPTRAMDAAIVPISIDSKLDQTPDRYIKNLYLVIDNNPSPLAAVFHFPGKHSWETLSTRVRVNAYTDLRAIAELSDGEIYMVSNFVKVSGGCSAPPVKDQVAAAATLGNINFNLPENYQQGDLVATKLKIMHPNNSGLQYNIATGYYISADFIRTIEVTYNGEEVFTADTDISISEDPDIKFGFTPQEKGVLEVHVKDSKGRSFSHSMNLPAHKG